MQARPLRLTVALLAILLAGVLGAAPIDEGQPAGGPEPIPAAATVEVAGDPALAPSPAGRTGAATAAWRWVTARAIGTLLGLVGLLVAAAWLALRARSSGAWRLVRPERGLPTARHGSPLAARRAPPAPAGC